jgi:DNA-binding NtrC family response regulator
MIAVPFCTPHTTELRILGKGMLELTAASSTPAIPARLDALVERYAPSDTPVVITGPIGVGKSYLARRLHERSGRPGAFVPVPLTSLQAGFEHVTLAGHDKGAYTGAHQRRSGLLAEATGGTLFLDEIGDASVEGQRLLLELLTERGLRRLGEERRIRYDLRFVLATHVDLDQATVDGRFREDLLSRLGHCWIRLLPLRDRPEEIPALVEHYLTQFAGVRDARRPRLDAELGAVLAAAPWVYNVRSLVNECQALATAIVADRALGIADLSERFWAEVRGHLASLPDDPTRTERALHLSAGDRKRAEGLLALSGRTLQRHLAKGGTSRSVGRPRGRNAVAGKSDT